MKEDNEACGEAAAAAASVCDIEPREGRTLSAALISLPLIYLFISFFIYFRQKQNISLDRCLMRRRGLWAETAAGVLDCQPAAVTLDDEVA